MIRGAIPFGLVLRLDKSLPHRGLIITTTLSLVATTTIFFGFTMSFMEKLLISGFNKKGDEYKAMRDDDDEDSDYSEEDFYHPNS